MMEKFITALGGLGIGVLLGLAFMDESWTNDCIKLGTHLSTSGGVYICHPKEAKP